MVDKPLIWKESLPGPRFTEMQSKISMWRWILAVTPSETSLLIIAPSLGTYSMGPGWCRLWGWCTVRSEASQLRKAVGQCSLVASPPADEGRHPHLQRCCSRMCKQIASDLCTNCSELASKFKYSRISVMAKCVQWSIWKPMSLLEFPSRALILVLGWSLHTRHGQGTKCKAVPALVLPAARVPCVGGTGSLIHA